MKKLLLTLLIFGGYALATTNHNPVFNDCNDWHQTGCGEQGEQGERGDTGQTGATGAMGETGQNGTTGSQGETGDTGATGQDGINGQDGIDGIDGVDGASLSEIAEYYSDEYARQLDVIADIAESYNQVIDELMSKAKEATEYYEDLAAGSAALAAVDFGTTAKGVTELGFGIGHSSSFDGSSTVGALGAKYGLTDTEASIVKGWYSGNESYAIGGAITTRF